MALTILLIIAAIGILLLVGFILGAVILAARSDQAGGAFSARQDWMDSHGEENEIEGS